jgi:hypothetical protein
VRRNEKERKNDFKKRCWKSRREREKRREGGGEKREGVGGVSGTKYSHHKN